MNFKNKVIVITGASSGIGEAAAEKFAKKGANIVLVARRKDKLEEVEKKLKQLGCPKVNLLVRSDNVEVSNFYESIDYKKQDDVSVFGKRLISDD